nr:hypothetical protein CFP56_00320 [Quercus suber]
MGRSIGVSTFEERGSSSMSATIDVAGACMNTSKNTSTSTLLLLPTTRHRIYEHLELLQMALRKLREPQLAGHVQSGELFDMVSSFRSEHTPCQLADVRLYCRFRTDDKVANNVAPISWIRSNITTPTPEIER